MKLRVASVAILAPLSLLAQPDTRPTFDVATVKPNVSGSPLSRWDPDHHGGFQAENTSLQTLISFAYGVPKLMVSGPAWMDSLLFDVQAKGAAEAADSQIRLMLQKLLEERFRLRAHREKKEMSVYFLEIAGGGLKAPRADPVKPAASRLPRGSWSYTKRTGTLADFAKSLWSFAGRPVLDRTNTSGSFELELWFNNRTDSEGPDLVTALREELGLTLRSGRDLVETLVVDEAVKVPAEN